MNKRLSLHKILFIALLIIISFASRFVDHPANFTAMGALFLFSGMFYNSRWILILPLGVMMITDGLIGFYAWPIMMSVYGSFALIFVLGKFLSKNQNTLSLLSGSLLGAVLFYLVTNWAVWMFGIFYPPTLKGLMESYYLALPFFRNTLAGDLTYALAFYASYKLIISLPEKRLSTSLIRQFGS